MTSPTEDQNNAFVRGMLQSRTIGQETISRQGTAGEIFDDWNLALLREYCADPSKKDEFLRKHDMQDEDGNKPGTRSLQKGNLIGYAIRTGAFPDEQAELLDRWFKEGAGKDLGLR